jgi:hypothetical protein
LARPRQPGRNTEARSFRQLKRFRHVINSDEVFGTHREIIADILWDAAQALTTPVSGPFPFHVIEGAERYLSCVP